MGFLLQNPQTDSMTLKYVNLKLHNLVAMTREFVL